MNVCKLNAEDIITYRESLQKLLKICFQNTYKREVLDEVIESKYTGLINYIESRKAYIFGAIENDCLLGFLWGYPVDTPIETVFHVAYISVMDGGRRLGIGQRLLDEAEKECKKLGLKHVELIVGAENTSALSFYDHCGYKVNRYYMRKKVR